MAVILLTSRGHCMSLRPRAVAAERAVAPSLSSSQRPQHGRLHHVLSVGHAECEKELAVHVQAKEEYKKKLAECERKLAVRVEENSALADLMQNLRGELGALESKLQACTEVSSGQLDQIAEMQQEVARAAQLVHKMKKLLDTTNEARPDP